MKYCTFYIFSIVNPFYLFYFTIDHKSVKIFLTTKNLFLSKIHFLFWIFLVLKSSKYFPVVPAVFSLFLLTRRTYAYWYWRIHHHMWVSGRGGGLLPPHISRFEGNVPPLPSDGSPTRRPSPPSPLAPQLYSDRNITWRFILYFLYFKDKEILRKTKARFDHARS